MPAYAAHVTTAATDVTDDQLDQLVDDLAPFAGVPALLDGRLSVQLTVDADHLLDAHERALAAVNATASRRLDFIPDVVGVEVLTAQEFDRRLNGPPAVDDLIPTSEAATLLGVARQRVLQLADTHPDFPRPIRRGRSLLWPRPALRTFLSSWQRSPGPRTPAARV